MDGKRFRFGLVVGKSGAINVIINVTVNGGRVCDARAFLLRRNASRTNVNNLIDDHSSARKLGV